MAKRRKRKRLRVPRIPATNHVRGNKSLTGEEMARRNYNIRRLFARGWRPPQIAEAFKLTPQTVRNILKHTAENYRREIEHDPKVFALLAATGFEQDIVEASELIDKLPPKFAASKVGALKVRLDARDRFLKVLQSLGLIHEAPVVGLTGRLGHEDAARILHGGTVENPTSTPPPASPPIRRKQPTRRTG